MEPKIISIRREERVAETLPELLDLGPLESDAPKREVPGGTYTLVEVANLGRDSLGGPTRITTLTYGPTNPFPETEEALWERIMAIHHEDLANYRAGD